MAKGFDCAEPLTVSTADSFKANGYEFVARYLVPATSAWKALTAAEAAIIQAAGLKIVSVYETTADRALAGYQAGLRDGSVAKQVAAEVGQPEGSCIYFAVDFDVTTQDEMDTVIAYIRGCNDATPTFSTGVYGEYDVCKAVCEAKAASHAWQTYAWSRGLLYENAQIYQWLNGPGGADYDEDKSFGSEGWWGEAPAPVEVKPAAILDPGVALTIINTWISPSWFATTDVNQQNYYKWLANSLRDAAGLERE
jgi:hypothetical protein